MASVACSASSAALGGASECATTPNSMERIPNAHSWNAVFSVSQGRHHRLAPRSALANIGSHPVHHLATQLSAWELHPKLRLRSSSLLCMRERLSNRNVNIYNNHNTAGSFVVRASSRTPTHSDEPRTNPITSFLQAIQSVLSRLFKPLSDFGFGKRSLKEGAVGLFLITGGIIFALTVSWIKSSFTKSGFVRYQAVIEFAQACGITVGTPVRIRGVDVGTVVKVVPSLKQIDVVVEMSDQSVIIPKNSLIEVNQSGLISETMIDITPQLPIPEPKVGPLHPTCTEEGLIVCDRSRIKGSQGVSLDELVSICTKLAKQMDQEGIHNMFTSIRQVNSLAEDVKPLLSKVQEMATEIAPMLKELRQGDLLKNVESLTVVAIEAAKDLKKMNDEILTKENTQMLRESVSTLTKTLKHVENISKDVSGLTGDPATRSNLKQLIESLSRLVED